MKVNKRIKWYCKNNYLELFDPKSDKIISIEFDNIEKIWRNIFLSESDIHIVNEDQEEVVSIFLSFLNEHNLIEG